MPSDSSGGGVSAFSIASSGSLSAVAGSPFIAGSYPSAVAVTPDGSHLYVANDSAGGGVSAFSIAADGSLSAVPGSPFSMAGSPYEVAISPDGSHLYVSANGPDGVAAFSIAPSGGLSAVTGSPFLAGSSPCGVAVTADGRHLYVTNSGSNDVSAFSIASDGSLSTVTGSPFSAGSAPCGASVTPDGARLYITDGSGSGNVWAFSTASDGSLTAVPGSPFSAGVADGAVAVSPDGSRLYVTNQSLSGSVSAFSIAADGGLSAVGGSPFGAGAYPIGVTVTPDGRNVYAANYGSTTISGLAVGSDGGLSAIAGSPFTAGSAPLYLAVSPDQGPVAAFSATSGPAGSTSAFDASASHDPDGTVVRYDWSFGDGTTALNAGPNPAHVYSTAGLYTVTVRVTDDAGCSTSQTFTGQTVSCNGSPAAQTSQQVAISAPTGVGPGGPTALGPGGPTGVGPPALVLSRLRLRPNAFQAAHNGSAVIRAGDVGSEVSYRDTLAAHARLRVYRELPGTRRGKRCVTPPHGVGHGDVKRCTRLALIGSFTHADRAGQNRLRFSGRLHGRALGPGRYLLGVTATLAGRSGRAIRASFRILAPPARCQDPDHDADCDKPGEI